MKRFFKFSDYAICQDKTIECDVEFATVPVGKIRYLPIYGPSDSSFRGEFVWSEPDSRFIVDRNKFLDLKKMIRDAITDAEIIELNVENFDRIVTHFYDELKFMGW